MKPEEIVDAYDKLCVRALAILDGAPYHKYSRKDEWAVLRIDGEMATLSWPDVGISYDCIEWETECGQFPSHLLDLTEDEFTAWKSEEVAKEKKSREREQALREVRERAAEERNARVLYERLKKRFED